MSRCFFSVASITTYTAEHRLQLKAPLKVDAPKSKKNKTAEAAKLVEKNPFTL